MKRQFAPQVILAGHNLTGLRHHDLVTEALRLHPDASPIDAARLEVLLVLDERNAEDERALEPWQQALINDQEKKS